MFCSCSAGFASKGNQTLSYLFQKTGATRHIWPLGDSLTLGVKADGTTGGGYRELEYNWVTANSYLANTVGTLSNGTWPNPFHDGHSGYKTAQLLTLVQTVYPGVVPVADGVILSIGTNDCATSAYDGPTEEIAYRTILDDIRAASVDTVIVVMTVPPQFGAASEARVLNLNTLRLSTWAAFNAAQPVGSPPLVIVDLHAALGGVWSPAYYDASQIHFNDAGYAVEWAAIQTSLIASGHVAP